MSALASGDYIEDVAALRAGATAAVLAQRVAPPSTVGTFPRSSVGATPVSGTRSGAAPLRPDVEA